MNELATNRDEMRSIVRIATAAAPLFAELGWEYDSGENAHVPDAAELAGTLLSLWLGVEKGGYVASGRWHVRWDEEEDGEEEPDKSISLAFDLEGINPVVLRREVEG